MREVTYLEKRNFNPIKTGIKNNKELCREIIKLYEDNTISGQELIYIISVIEGVKPGATFSDSSIQLQNANEVRESKIYKLLVKYKIPFRVDVFGKINSNEKYSVEMYSGSYPLYSIATDFEKIKSLIPFHHIGRNNSMVDVEKKYMKEWGNFLGVPEKDNAWMNEEPISNTTPTTIIGLSYKENLNFENINFATLVPYIPYPSKKGLKRAINTGEKYYNAIKKFDSVMNVNYGINEFHENVISCKSYGKRDVIRCEFYENINKNNNEVIHSEFVNKIKKKYKFNDKLINNKLRDIIYSDNIKTHKNKYYLN